MHPQAMLSDQNHPDGKLHFVSNQVVEALFSENASRSASTEHGCGV